eukprot:TRINITY_DN3557_c0_g2_i2.p1 TRINITY_DN3557_c0_g2~~TRINITY_DN3557_c0_g2_i2.p1  ORF type:complete len:375 (-),score=65.47 TRINITY_DN3557_c0_g2_i2:170-1234(-)
MCIRDRRRVHGSFDYQKKTSMNFDWGFPMFWRNTSMNLSYSLSDRIVDANVKEHNDGTYIRITNQKGDRYAVYSDVIRDNQVSTMDCSQYVLENETLPSHKRSVKIGAIFRSNVRQSMSGPTETGEHLEGSLEFTTPGSSVKFAKMELTHRKFFTLRNAPTFIKNVVRFNEDVNIENAFYAGAIFPLTRRANSYLRMNDRFYFYNLRGFQNIGDRVPPQNTTLHPCSGSPGFEYLGDHLGSDLVLRNSLKLNFYQYPLIHKVNGIAFLHLTGAYLSGPVFQTQRLQALGPVVESKATEEGGLKGLLKRNTRLSAGLGLALNMGGGRLEVLYNMFHVQNPSDSKARFQIRISFND